jgi:hypothetical protein
MPDNQLEDDDGLAFSGDVEDLPSVLPTSPYEDFERLRMEIRAYNNSGLYQKYKSVIPMTISMLREEYGDRGNWWGDLSASESRKLYWRLLPNVSGATDLLFHPTIPPPSANSFSIVGTFSYHH